MELLLIVSAMVSAGVYWYWRSDDARRTRRVLRKTRVTKVLELVDGQLACVVGTIELESPTLLVSMIAKKKCVAYDTVIYFFDGHNATVPKKVEVERKMVPFFVRDSTGVVRIDGAEAALCNRPAASSERYHERVIVPGAKIRIVGSVHLDHARDHGLVERDYREATRTKATLTGTVKFPLLIDLER